MNTMTNELTMVLDDLVKINNDRITGYEKAADESKKIDIALPAIFLSMANLSRRNVAALTERISTLGGESEGGTTTAGKIYRAWMDVKHTFSGNDRVSVLEACEYGEDAAQKAYKDALATDADIDVETRQLITDQQAALKNDHDTIKKYRDVQKN